MKEWGDSARSSHSRLLTPAFGVRGHRAIDQGCWSFGELRRLVDRSGPIMSLAFVETSRDDRRPE